MTASKKSIAWIGSLLGLLMALFTISQWRKQNKTQKVPQSTGQAVEVTTIPVPQEKQVNAEIKPPSLIVEKILLAVFIIWCCAIFGYISAQFMSEKAVELVKALVASETFQSANLPGIRGMTVGILSLLTTYPFVISIAIKVTVGKKWAWTKVIDDFMQNTSVGMFGALVTFLLISVVLGGLEQIEAQKSEMNLTSSSPIILTREQEQQLVNLLADRLSTQTCDIQDETIAATPESTATSESQSGTVATVDASEIMLTLTPGLTSEP